MSTTLSNSRTAASLGSHTSEHIPDGWQVVRLGDVASLRREQIKPEGGDPRPYVGLEHIKSKGSLNGYAQAGESVSNKTVFLKGDTLFGKLRPNLRKVVRASFDGLCSTDILAVFPKGLNEASLLSYILQSDQLHEHAMRGITGTRMPRTSWNHLQSFKLAYPPLPEQRAIAAILDSIDQAIETTDALISATEQLRDSLLHTLLTRGLPGRHAEWKQVPGLGTIPTDWQAALLGDILESTTYGTNVSLGENGGVPILRMNNLQNGKIDLSDVRRANLADRELLTLDLVRGDILFNRTNSRDLVGKVAIVHSLPNPTSFASYLVRLRVKENLVDPFWLAALMVSKSCQSRIRRFATPGVSQANINPTSLKALIVPLPSLPEQQAIAAILESVDESIEKGRGAGEGLRLLKAAAADTLLTGRVRVTPEETGR